MKSAQEIPAHVAKVRDEKAEQLTEKLPHRYEGRNHPKLVGQEWYKVGFNSGYLEEAREIEEKYREVVEAAKEYLYNLTAKGAASSFTLERALKNLEGEETKDE